MKNLKMFSLGIAMLISFLTFGQEKTITGTVTDASGPIPGANVVVKSTTRYTQTDVDGKYSIKAKQGEKLVFSFIGYNDIQVTVGQSNIINVKLNSESVQLNDVVVCSALGLQKRKSAITYSSEQRSSNKVSKRKSKQNAIQPLVGKVSGLAISTNASHGVLVHRKKSRNRKR